jgi:UDP-N-acetyl-D-glucosamine dehydrogenase
MEKNIIGIIGLGYVGLPLAILSSHKGLKTIGLDVDEKKINQIKKGNYLLNEEYLYSWNVKNAEFTSDVKELKKCNIKIICVPTPINKENLPDLDCVEKATKTVLESLNEGDLVVIESTIYPGVCEDVVKLILDKSGKEYYLAHCPERINPGDKKWNVSNIPRVVGGLDKKAGIKAKEFYESLGLKVTLLKSVKEAEATKILENTFRDINIAFINEMAQSFYRMGIDVMEVIKGASTKPFSFMAHYPGVGVGGHCIAVDPYYMIQKGREAGFDHEFLKLARKINSGMPRYVVKMIQNELNLLGLPVKDTKIAILGLAYKNNVGDDRESPSYQLIKILQNKKADLRIFDPYLVEKSNVKTLKEAITGAEVIVLCAAHDEFINNQKMFLDAKLIIDGRNKLDKTIFENKVVYKGVGVR